MAGGAAGAIAQTVIYPLEICKTRLAVSAPGTYSGVVDCVQQVKKPRTSTCDLRKRKPDFRITRFLRLAVRITRLSHAWCIIDHASYILHLMHVSWRPASYITHHTSIHLIPKNAHTSYTIPVVRNRWYEKRVRRRCTKALPPP
jgi:hypothetical protein